MAEKTADTQSYTLAEIATLLGAELVGDGTYIVSGIASLENATPREVSFLASSKFELDLRETTAGAVVLKSSYAEQYTGNKLIVADPYCGYAKLSGVFDPKKKRPLGIHPTAVVEDNAKVSALASIGANCYIGSNAVIGDYSEVHPGVVISENSVIGDYCLIYSNVSIYHDVRIGNQVIIHSGAVIGSDGFGFAPSKDEGWVKIHQLGGVIIGDRVEIGASSAIDRGALGNTIIEDGVIIDNQVHLAHNVKVGSGTAIAGCVGIAGSTTLGRDCTVAGAVAINGHLDIADNSHFHGGTIVTKGNKEAGAFASAAPLQEVKKWRRNSVRFTQLDQMAARLSQIEKKVEEQMEENK